MRTQRQRLQSEVGTLRDRLHEMNAREVTERDRPMYEVGLLAIKSRLTALGQQLNRLHGYGAHTIKPVPAVSKPVQQYPRLVGEAGYRKTA